MTALKAVIGFACAGLACSTVVASFVGASHAEQQQNEAFELAMCNLSDFQGMFVALRHKQDSQTWMVDGWNAIPDGGCAFIGTFPRDTIYYYAESNDGGTWRAADTDQTGMSECIDHDKWFQHAADATPCPAGQVIARFRKITIPPTLPRLTFTLSGKK